jgi:Flp pilus assembly protein TadG
VLPFVATVTAALLASAGLAVDGGNILAARREASGVAAAAARRGSEELAWRDVTSGRAALDADRAIAAAQSYLRQAGVGGTATAAPNRVTVTVTISEPTVVLGAFGIGPKTVSATRSASPFAGG